MGYGAGLPGYGAGRGTGYGAGAGGRYGAGTGSGYGAGLAADWTPLSLSSLLAAWYSADGVLWQDSARTTRVTANGDPVGAWDDASGNGWHLLQTDSAKRPTWVASGPNGRPVVNFDGVDDYLLASGLLMGATYTCGALTERSGSASRYLIGAKASGTCALISVYAADFEFYGGSPRIVIAATDAATSGLHSVVFGGGAGGMATRFDGAAAGTDATAAPTGDADFTLGSQSGGGAVFFDGKVSEVVLSTAYTAPILASVDSYLNARR